MDGRSSQGRTGDPLRFTASTPGIARDGKSLRVEDWYLEDYRRNPVFLFAHQYTLPPIGRAEVSVAADRLIADVVFDQEDPFAREVERKYRRGFMNAVSVGWDEKVVNGRKRLELLDISAVPVGADAQAVIERMRRQLAALNGRHKVTQPARPAWQQELIERTTKIVTKTVKEWQQETWAELLLLRLKLLELELRG
jgi:hypothetical protein